jgi:integrase
VKTTQRPTKPQTTETSGKSTQPVQATRMVTMSNRTKNELSQSFSELGQRQQDIFESKVERFKQYLRSEGKDPLKQKGYAEKSIGTRVSRVLQAIQWIWEQDGATTEITPEQADQVIESLATDDFRRQDNGRYREDSKRKISDALVNWFQFKDSDWEPDITFQGEASTDNADPFTKNEVSTLWEASLTYKSIPKYNNLTPEERDRWRRYLAQELGKPKNDVNPADWEKVNTSWKIPSIIGTERAAGWRPALIERMKVDWYDANSKTIIIPGSQAVKNDSQWVQHLPNKATDPLERWIEQRENIKKYDNSDYMWLNRKGNPYNSKTLNDLLDGLIEEAEVSVGGRKISWYSFRHTLGTYTYEEFHDLEIVAETLRQNSTASAARYVHPTDEILRNAANIL